MPGADFDSTGSDWMFTAVPIFIGIVFVLVVAGIIASVVFRLRNRTAIAQYRQDMLKVPGAILKAAERGDTATVAALQALLQQNAAGRRNLLAQQSLLDQSLLNQQGLIDQQNLLNQQPPAPPLP